MKLTPAKVSLPKVIENALQSAEELFYSLPLPIVCVAAATVAVTITALASYAWAEFALGRPFQDRIMAVEPKHHGTVTYENDTVLPSEWGLRDMRDFIFFADTHAWSNARLGIDLDRVVTEKDIEQTVQNALPYIAHELGTDKVFDPYIEVYELDWYSAGKRNSLGQNSLETIRVELTIPLRLSKLVSTHETVHAQRMKYNVLMSDLHKAAKDLFGGFPGSPLNESFAEVVTWEVLANQALDGDALAKYALLSKLGENITREYNNEPVVELSDTSRKYVAVPMRAIMGALRGGSDSYEGVRLDGIKELIRREVELYQQSTSKAEEMPSARSLDNRLDDWLFVKRGGLWVPANERFATRPSGLLVKVPDRELELQHLLRSYPELDTPAYEAAFMAQFGKP